MKVAAEEAAFIASDERPSVAINVGLRDERVVSLLKLIINLRL